MKQVEKQLGRKPLALQGPEFPTELSHIWEWFIELSAARQPGSFGPAPLSFSEIKAWSDLMNTDLSGWEVELIKDLDSIYMKVVSNVRH